MRITFLKTRKPKQFSYMPRYYDEQKEEAAKRQKRIEAEIGIEENKEVYRSRLTHGVMTEKLNANRKNSRTSVLRLLIIIVLLILMALYLLRDMDSLNFLAK